MNLKLQCTALQGKLEFLIEIYNSGFYPFFDGFFRKPSNRFCVKNNSISLRIKLSKNHQLQPSVNDKKK